MRLLIVLVLFGGNRVTGAPTVIPAIRSVQNAYSYVPSGTPNYGIAQGTMILITGVGLAADSIGQQFPPLPITVDGVSVDITTSGTTTPAILYSVTPTRIGAIVPSATPIGPATVTVNNNGQSSAPVAIQVVQSAFGIITLNQLGTGQASAFDVAYNSLGFTNAANPGDTIVLWGSGLGPVQGDETLDPVQQDLTDIPVEVQIGGIPAAVVYHGRSTFPGLDQINVTVPQGVPAGCRVSLVVVTGGIASNFATIPVANSGRVCSDPVSGLSQSQILSVANKDAFNLGMITFGETTQYYGTRSDDANATFATHQSAEFSVQPGPPSIGNCLVEYSPPPSSEHLSFLDVGKSLSIDGEQLVYRGIGQFTAHEQMVGSIGTGFHYFIFVSPNFPVTFNISNASGGADIKAFSQDVQLGPSLTLTNTAPGANGLTISWMSGPPGGYLQITGSSIASLPSLLSASFTCTAARDDGQFTVPPIVLLALPMGGDGVDLTITSYNPMQNLAIEGLDLALVQTYLAHKCQLSGGTCQ